jgi:ABC-type spermidine/putrescine transport system permease subunit II
VTVFNKRNALVGFLTLKAAQRTLSRRRERRRRSAKIAAFVTLGIVSVGIVAAIAAVLHRRSGEEGQQMQGYAVGDDDSEIVGEYVTAPESLPAT